MDEQVPDGGVQLSPAELETLDVRWAGAWRPSAVAQRLAGIDVPWCVAAGWALDLFRGGQTRVHGDLEIAVPAARFAEVRARFPGLVFDAVSSGWIWENAGPEVMAATHQTWLRDPETDGFLVDVFREPHDGDTWICRRDEAIRMSYEAVIGHTAEGIPYLVPELVLLFKAKAVREKDQTDFDGAVPLMTPRQRRSLAELLDRVHPGHPWLAALSRP